MLLLLLAPSALELRPSLGRREAVLSAITGALVPPLASPHSLFAATPPSLCDPAVSLLSQGDKEITLIGTAHISEESAELVRRVIREVRPDTVMLELDSERAARMPALTRGDGSLAAAAEAAPPASDRTNNLRRIASRLLRGEIDDVSADAVGLGLSRLYKSLDSLGFQSGNEFVVATEEARALGATILLGDRDVRVTLRRLRDALAAMVASGALTKEVAPPTLLAESGLSGSSELTYNNVKSSMTVLKERANVRELTNYMKAEARPLYDALISERDDYMVCAS